MNEPARTAVVVGGGFGGLALAIRLQAAGVQVTLVERRRALGGRAYRLEDRGYTFDMGPSLITAPHVLDSVFRAAGRRLDDEVDLIPLDPYYRIFFHDGSHIDYVGDPDRMREQMARFDPGDAERLDGFMKAVRPIYDAVITERLGSTPFDSLGSMIRFIPRMARLGAHVSVTRFVHRWFNDFRHRFIYSFHPLFVGGNPFATPAVYLMIPFLEREGGVWFTRGGMYSVVEAMERVFREIGGTVRTGAEVEEILVEGGRAVGVRLAESAARPPALEGPVGDEGPGAGAEPREVRADAVISNADPGHTYGKLVPAGARKRWSDRKLERTKWAMSCFLLYIGTRKRYPQLEHHTLILTERYQGLLDDIFDHKTLPDDFSMYLHAPTRTDPSMAPEGCESMYVLVPVANLRSGLDWSELGQPFTERVLDVLEAWGMEDLRDSIQVLHAFTPDDFESELNATFGNAFSIEPRLTQTAWFRPQNRSEDVERLYLVGAGTHPGAGVPGVLLSAETTYACMAEDLGLPAAWDADTPGRVALDTSPVGPEAFDGSR